MQRTEPRLFFNHAAADAQARPVGFGAVIVHNTLDLSNWRASGSGWLNRKCYPEKSALTMPVNSSSWPGQDTRQLPT